MCELLRHSQEYRSVNSKIAVCRMAYRLFILDIGTCIPLSLQIFAFTRKMQIILCNNFYFLKIHKNNRYLHQFSAQLKPVFCIFSHFEIICKESFVKKSKNIKNANLRGHGVKHYRVSSFTVLWILINTIKGAAVQRTHSALCTTAPYN